MGETAGDVPPPPSSAAPVKPDDRLAAALRLDPAATAVRLHLVRHGRTAYNASGRLRGLDDPPLDAAGRAEVARAAAWLGGRQVDGLWSSPLLRATETAAAVTRTTGLACRLDARLQDRDYGPWTGHQQHEVERRFGGLDAAPGVESRAALAGRLAEALRAVLASGCGAPVLVTHVACIREMLGAATGRDPESFPQATAACNVLLLAPRGPELELLNVHPEGMS